MTRQRSCAESASRSTRRPKAVLYVHLTKESLEQGEGVARVEGIGPVTVDQAKQWLGDCTITIKPVIDIAGIAPVDAYEIPDHIREAVHLIVTGRHLPLRVLPQPQDGPRPHHPLRRIPTTADHPAKPGSGNSDP